MQVGTIYKHRLHFLNCIWIQNFDAMPWKEQTIMEKKLSLFVNGELENTPSQSFAEFLKSQDRWFTKSLTGMKTQPSS